MDTHMCLHMSKGGQKRKTATATAKGKAKRIKCKKENRKTAVANGKLLAK